MARRYEFYFRVAKQYLTNERSEWVKYCFSLWTGLWSSGELRRGKSENASLVQSLRLWQKKKVLPHAKNTWRRCHCMKVGARAFSPPSPPLLHHLFYASWHEALGTPFPIGPSLYFRCKGCNHFIFNLLSQPTLSTQMITRNLCISLPFRCNTKVSLEYN